MMDWSLDDLDGVEIDYSDQLSTSNTNTKTITGSTKRDLLTFSLFEKLQSQQPSQSNKTTNVTVSKPNTTVSKSTPSGKNVEVGSGNTKITINPTFSFVDSSDSEDEPPKTYKRPPTKSAKKLFSDSDDSESESDKSLKNKSCTKPSLDSFRIMSLGNTSQRTPLSSSDSTSDSDKVPTTPRRSIWNLKTTADLPQKSPRISKGENEDTDVAQAQKIFLESLKSAEDFFLSDDPLTSPMRTPRSESPRVKATRPVSPRVPSPQTTFPQVASRPASPRVSSPRTSSPRSEKKEPASPRPVSPGITTRLPSPRNVTTRSANVQELPRQFVEVKQEEVKKAKKEKKHKKEKKNKKQRKEKKSKKDKKGNKLKKETIEEKKPEPVKVQAPKEESEEITEEELEEKSDVEASAEEEEIEEITEEEIEEEEEMEEEEEIEEESADQDFEEEELEEEKEFVSEADAEEEVSEEFEEEEIEEEEMEEKPSEEELEEFEEEEVESIDEESEEESEVAESSIAKSEDESEEESEEESEQESEEESEEEESSSQASESHTSSSGSTHEDYSDDFEEDKSDSETSSQSSHRKNKKLKSSRKLQRKEKKKKRLSSSSSTTTDAESKIFEGAPPGTSFFSPMFWNYPNPALNMMMTQYQQMVQAFNSINATSIAPITSVGTIPTPVTPQTPKLSTESAATLKSESEELMVKLASEIVKGIQQNSPTNSPTFKKLRKSMLRSSLSGQADTSLENSSMNQSTYDPLTMSQLGQAPSPAPTPLNSSSILTNIDLNRVQEYNAYLPYKAAHDLYKKHLNMIHDFMEHTRNSRDRIANLDLKIYSSTSTFSGYTTLKDTKQFIAQNRPSPRKKPSDTTQ